jgi:RimJ/RimL family protein N-acetyltransferase/uridine phosphorylase
MFRTWASDPDVAKYMPWLPHESVAFTSELLGKWVAAYENQAVYNWAIVPRELGEPVGSISVVALDEAAQSLEIGYTMSKAWWNQGIMTEALTELIRFFFEDVGASRIAAKHIMENVGSGRVMQKSGMRLEGIARKSRMRRGTLYDMASYAILAVDYFAGNNTGVVKYPYPILEYDNAPYGIIRADRRVTKPVLPPVCVMTFFGEVLRNFIDANDGELACVYRSEMRNFPAYKVNYKGTELGVVQAAVAAPAAAALAEFLIANGVKLIICCGGCGALDDIPLGDVIVPTAALRDEGTSYHYLPPERWIQLDGDVLALIRDTLSELDVPFIERKTWTTDSYLRETRDMVTYRKSEGCSVVEMECSALATVAAYRGVKFGQLLYSGDTLADSENYDEREWTRHSVRGRLFELALEVALRSFHK